MQIPGACISAKNGTSSSSPVLWPRVLGHSQQWHPDDGDAGAGGWGVTAHGSIFDDSHGVLYVPGCDRHVVAAINYTLYR